MDFSIFASVQAQMGCFFESSGKCFCNCFSSQTFWSLWAGKWPLSMFPETPNLISMLWVHLAREQQGQVAPQGKRGWELSRGCRLIDKGAVPQHPNRKGRTGSVTVTRAQPSDQITREVCSDDGSPRSSQEFAFMDQSQGPDLGGEWPEDRLGCDTIEA